MINKISICIDENCCINNVFCLSVYIIALVSLSLSLSMLVCVSLKLWPIMFSISMHKLITFMVNTITYFPHTLETHTHRINKHKNFALNKGLSSQNKYAPCFRKNPSVNSSYALFCTYVCILLKHDFWGHTCL